MLHQNQKGFAISGIMYAILILFLVLVLSILALMGNRKLILDKTKLDVMKRLNGETEATQLSFEWSEIVLSNLVTDLNSIDLKQGVHAKDEKGQKVDSSYITYTLDPNFKLGVVGTYFIIYTVTPPLSNPISEKAVLSVQTTTPELFAYTGNIQTYIAKRGQYRIEAWGASGGNIGSYQGGAGAYTAGNLALDYETDLFLTVGGAGSNTDLGGYNGGGSLTTGQLTFGSSGGGASDVRLESGTSWDQLSSLKSRIMVAAGGGGANFRDQGYGEGNGGAGGSLVGGDGASMNFDSGYGHGIGLGGTQFVGGSTTWVLGTAPNSDYARGIFGQGGDVSRGAVQSGGGGGYYGGGASAHGGAGGGSSFISGFDGCIAIDDIGNPVVPAYTGIENSYHVSKKIFQNPIIQSGTESIPTLDSTSTSIGNRGNGQIKITPLVSYQ